MPSMIGYAVSGLTSTSAIEARVPDPSPRPHTVLPASAVARTWRQTLLLLLLFCTLSITTFGEDVVRIKLTVDATEVGRNIIHTSLTLPVESGPLTLFYPKWIPGEHGPTGPINNMAGLSITSGGEVIPWRRDDIEMFAFHCTIPEGVHLIEVAFDDVSQPDTVSSSQLAYIKWNRFILYPGGIRNEAVRVQASLRLPVGWVYGTALPVMRKTKNVLEFVDASLAEIVDSPVIIGAHFRRVALGGPGALHELDIAADSQAALEMRPETLAGLTNLVEEATTLFGARHYKTYHFLLGLTDHGGEVLEHHESSENAAGEKALDDTGQLLDLVYLLAHEYAHSWNGKYRSPEGLAAPDFEQPMKGDLLWVYEGLTEYVGRLLAARSGLWTRDYFRESIASAAAEMDHQSGRKWRPLVDTATAVQITYSSPRAWRNYRRRVDFYIEGLLLWMDADVIIRTRSDGRSSLDDFLRDFFGGQDSPPSVNTYTFDDVVNGLNRVAPYDWREFLNERVDTITQHPPMGGITGAGWKLIYNEEPNQEMSIKDQRRKSMNLTYSCGFIVKGDGSVLDVSPDSPAGKAGLAPGMKLIAINGSAWSSDALLNAVSATKQSAAPLELVVQNGSSRQTFEVDYHGGARFPHLEREPAKPDLLLEIVKPRAQAGGGLPAK